MSKEAEKFIEKYTTKDQNDWLVEKKDIIAKFMESYHAEQLIIDGVMPRISYFKDDNGVQLEPHYDEVLTDIKEDGTIEFYVIDSDYQRNVLTPVYVA